MRQKLLSHNWGFTSWLTLYGIIDISSSWGLHMLTVFDCSYISWDVHVLSDIILYGIDMDLFAFAWLADSCYDLKSLGLDKRTNSCIRVNTRELNRELFTK